MNDDAAWVVAVMVTVMVLALSMTSIVLSDNVNEWVRTEDPDCYLHVREDNHLFTEDTVTRTRYCKEKS